MPKKTRTNVEVAQAAIAHNSKKNVVVFTTRGLCWDTFHSRETRETYPGPHADRKRGKATLDTPCLRCQFEEL